MPYRCPVGRGRRSRSAENGANRWRELKTPSTFSPGAAFPIRGWRPDGIPYPWCSAQYFGEILTGMPDFHGHVDHLLIDSLGMHVDLDGPPRADNALKHRAPEIVASFGDSALTMYPQREPRIPGQVFSSSASASRQYAACVSGVSPSMRCWARGTVGPLISMGPQSKLEFQPASRRLLDDEAEGLKVAFAFAVLQRYCADLVSGNVEQIRVGEVQIVAGHVSRKIVSPAESQAEAIEAIRDQSGQVVAPVVAIVEPAFVFDLAYEGAVDTADCVGGLFLDGLRRAQAPRQDRSRDARGRPVP